MAKRSRKPSKRVWVARAYLLARLLGHSLALGWKHFRQVPPKAQAAIALGLLIATWFIVNWTYQVMRKPTELFFPVSEILYKSPRETWAKYGSTFQSHSTAVISPDLLAALAQVEGAGNPVARTYWRWSFTAQPFEIYKPASSAVGMFQITDGTFEVARRFCVHDHAVVDEGPWYTWRSCWFNGLYSRVVPSHAIEMTSAHLDRQVAAILAGSKLKSVSLPQKQDLAAVIHLCGARVGEEFVRHRMRLPRGQRCGEHDAKSYLKRVNALRAEFAKLRTDIPIINP